MLTNLLSRVVPGAETLRSRLRSSTPKPVLASDLCRRFKVSMAPPIFDVRTADCYLDRRIPGTVSAPESDTGGLLRKIQGLDRFVLVCDNGVLSAMVARTLRFCGVHGARYLKGGLSAWSVAGGPLVETTPEGIERPLARFRESGGRKVFYEVVSAFSPQLVFIAVFAAALLLLALMIGLK